MPHTQEASGFRNRLLSIMSEEDRTLLRNHLEPVELPRKFIIANAGEPSQYAYFLETGLASMVARSPDGLEAEAGVIGREGFGPVYAALGVDQASQHHMIQIAGAGHRIMVFNWLTP